MKRVFYSIAAIAISCLGSNLMTVRPSEALDEGLYWGGGSRYIQIAKQVSSRGDKKSDRVCYQGFSSNGSMIVSLKLVIPRYETGIDYEVYSLEASKKSNLGDLSIQQYAFSPDKITFGKLVGRFVKGGLVYKLDDKSASNVTPAMQECLNSYKPYFKQILSGRDRR